MADLIPSSKSASHWTENDLLAFNIEAVTVNTTQFFGSPELPPAPVSQTILNNLEEPNGPLDTDERLFFKYMGHAEEEDSESSMNDFASHLLRLLHYDDVAHLIVTSRRIPFSMSGRQVSAKVNVSVLDHSGDYLLLVEGKRSSSSNFPLPPLVAKAIAAFHENNVRRTNAGHPLLASKVMSGIALLGTAPIFYHIPVTTALVDAVGSGTFPAEATVIERYIPSAGDMQDLMSEGMRPLVNRRIIFQCLEAFKAALILLDNSTYQTESKVFGFKTKESGPRSKCVSAVTKLLLILY
ncbi:hypothetical protein GALMADRAFT_266547 [Galerina marginata CBS 339.88]|uniref:Uncharacterized protein n=1 Tax=Galerina marginata (strain CBS 339.88) TaxID=685588 RepID=A0A067T4G5_GALM3|nr:hypothetical protein GALMADRAFT_266547 [Galerina marginata CBS 339.88]